MIGYSGMGLTTGGIIVLTIAIIWTMVWTGIALWKSGRNNQIAWFIVLFLINTLGILEIVYLAFFQKKSAEKTPVIAEPVIAAQEKVVKKTKK